VETRRLVVHGHFYQPPRENPWTEEVPREPGAAPFHDWNERIAAECYRPNGYARVVDQADRIVAIVNNYARLSFDGGPTLLSWLEVHEPDAYARLLAGDREGQGAIAHPWFHVILPLATERDARVNIRWGIADFRHRFGRDPEGLWLPETAVDDTTLRLLASEGIGYTILAPSQADRSVDTTRLYRWRDRVTLVFYDGPLSHDVAFGAPSSQVLVERVEAAAPDGGLVCVATDGETFGHHHHFADRSLAYALTVEAPRHGLSVGGLADHVRGERDLESVGVVTSAWSCAHGVGRWKEDCGCSTGGQPGWNQKWRGPVRRALDILRDAAHEAFARRGAECMHDPEAALDDYVHVLLGVLPRDEFVSRHVHRDPVLALTLLEAERHALAMYTSCGWFFADVAGLETVIILRYAARTIDLLRDAGENPPEDAFLHVLTEARSNVAAEGDGRQVWQRHVRPARVWPERIVAHLALVDVLDRPIPEGAVGGHRVELLAHEHRSRGALAVCTGCVAVTHNRTGRTTTCEYAAVWLGGLEVTGIVRAPVRDGALEALTRACDEGAAVTRLLRLLGDAGGTEFDLTWALPGHAREIVEDVAASLTDRFATTYDRLFGDHHQTLEALAAAGYALPAELRVAAEVALAQRFEAEVLGAGGSTEPRAYEAALVIVGEARRHGVQLATPAAADALAEAIATATQTAVATGTVEDADRALALLRLARDLDVSPRVDVAQEAVYDALVGGGSPALRALGLALDLAVEVLGSPS
jgi:hypothetical protein